MRSLKKTHAGKQVIIDIPPDFTSRLSQGRAKIFVALDGVETATAMTTQTYIESGIASF